MGAGRRGRRRDRRLPRRPGLGHGGALRPGSRPAGPFVRPRRRFPVRRRGLRLRVLRHLAAGGAGDGSAAAAAAGGGVGGVRARRHRPTIGTRHAYRGLCGLDVSRLRVPAASCARGARGLRRHRQHRQRRLRARRVHLRVGGSGGHGRHGLFVVAGRVAPGGAVAAWRGVRDGAGRCGHRAVVAVQLRGVQPPTRALARRAVQGVRRFGGRHRGVGGRRPRPDGTAVGRHRGWVTGCSRWSAARRSTRTGRAAA